MKGALLGFGLTAAAWVLFALMYSLIELAMGHVPFQYLEWGVGGKFLTFTISWILLLGGLIGYVSERIRAQKGR